jgi:hypothetical protein
MKIDIGGFFEFQSRNFKIYSNLTRKKGSLHEDHHREGQVTEDNIMQLLDIYGYRHTLRMSITYCFSTATMVTRTHLGVTMHVH